jgi:hypothetical protein
MTGHASFWTVAGRVFTAHKYGRYEEALDIVRESAPRFPDRSETLVYWEACSQARLNDPSQALTVLQQGLQRGLWWNPDMLRRDPDLETIRGDSGFAAIVEACEHRLSEARATALPDLQVYPPDHPSPTAWLLVALHWRLRHLADFTPWWLSTRHQDMLVAIPRSSQQLGMHGFGWDDRERATRELAETYERLRATEQFDPESVILATAPATLTCCKNDRLDSTCCLVPRKIVSISIRGMGMATYGRLHSGRRHRYVLDLSLAFIRGMPRHPGREEGTRLPDRADPLPRSHRAPHRGARSKCGSTSRINRSSCSRWFHDVIRKVISSNPSASYTLMCSTTCSTDPAATQPSTKSLA